jgi:GGDEF domain-containing protein
MNKDTEQKEDIEIKDEEKVIQETAYEFQDRSVYEEIFKEMLTLENARNFRNKQKYCLVKIVIENLDEAVVDLDFGDKNILLFKFSNFLFKNLRKKDIYLLSEPGSFLVLFPDISIETASIAMKRIQDEVKVEFKGNVSFKWKIVIGTDKEEDIKPIIKKAHLFSNEDARAMLKDSSKKEWKKSARGSRSISSGSVFKNFIFSFLVFTVVFIVVETILYYATSRLTIIPESLRPDVLINQYFPGLVSLFSSLNMEITPFLFFTFQILIVCFIFGLGMFAGFLINMKTHSNTPRESKAK